ncbi:MAG TPA: hypothetical protein VGS07_28655 [Thermoanaerobaculia bacterium]|nr:hypothetical protein [Thermoanaerobaculia bacterium]
MNRLLVLSVLAMAVMASPLAATPHWVPLGPYGGFVDTLTVDPAAPQVLYVTAGLQGTFKSVDGGASWGLVHIGIASGNVTVDPSRHTTIYQSLNFKQVLKSTDGGVTWSSSRRGLPNVIVTLLAVDPAKRTRVYVASDGVWHSLDGGFSWKSPRRPLPQGVARHVLALAVARRPAGTVYAATGAGVFKSIDAGDSWKPARQGLPAGEVTALAMAPTNPQILWASVGNAGIFRSTNGGASWRPTAGQPEAAGSVISLAVAPGDPSAAWAGTLDHGAYRTTDAGAHWTPAGPRATARVAALAATAATLYAGLAPGFRDPGGVLASGDGGVSWQPRNTGLFALETPAVAIDPHHPEILWAAAGPAGVYRSTQGGRVWELPTQPPAPDDPTSLPGLNDVAFSADGALLYTLFNQALWRSDDAGASWRLALGQDTTPSTPVFFFLPHPVVASTLYAWSAPNLYASHDSGATWQALSPPGPTCFFETLAVAPSAPATLYAGGANDNNGPFFCRNTRSSLAHSEDGGTSWAAADGGLGGVGVASLAVDPLDPRTVYAQSTEALVTPAGVWKSTDSGATWLRTGNLTADKLVFSAGGGTLWGIHGTQVFASHDGAASWQSVGGPQIFNIARLVPDPVDPNRLYAATNGGVWVLEP